MNGQDILAAHAADPGYTPAAMTHTPDTTVKATETASRQGRMGDPALFSAFRECSFDRFLRHAELEPAPEANHAHQALDLRRVGISAD